MTMVRNRRSRAVVARDASSGTKATAAFSVTFRQKANGRPVPQKASERHISIKIAPEIAQSDNRTVYSDLPLEPGRGPYQTVLQQVADAHGIMRADFAGVFSHQGRRLDILGYSQDTCKNRT